jgi:replicative DNA helicase
MFLYRPEYYSSSETDDQGNSLLGKAELIIGKQRNGPTGVVDLFFHRTYTRFDALTEESREAGAGVGGGDRSEDVPF